MSETWRSVPGYDSRYQVSDQGRVRSQVRPDAPLILRGVTYRGYRQVTITSEVTGVRKPIRIHTLVTAAFIGPRPPGMETRHLDGDGLNNALVNLAYGTSSENEIDKVRHGTHQATRKTHCPQGHPYSGPNLIVRTGAAAGRRGCRTCANERNCAYLSRLFVREVVEGIATESLTFDEGLQRLARRPVTLTLDPVALAGAVAAWVALRDLASGLTDVATLTEGAQPGVDRRAMAEAELERRLDEECSVLSRRRVAA